MLLVPRLMEHLDLLKMVSLLLLDEAKEHKVHGEKQDCLLFLKVNQFPF